MDVLRLLLKIGGWFFVVSSVICLVVSLFAYLHSRKFIRTATRAQGTVIRLEERRSDNVGAVYHPVVTFRDANGAEQELFSSVGQFPPPYKVGDTTTVLYPAEQPGKARLDGFFDVWGIALIAGLIGVFELIFGLAMLLVSVILGRVGQSPTRITKA